VTAIALGYGIAPALATICGSAVAAYHWLLAPLSALAFDPSGLRRLALFRLVVFAASGVAITLLAERQRRRYDVLERSRRQLRAFIADQDVGMQVVARDGRITWANEVMLRLLGYGEHEYVDTAFSHVQTDAAVAADVSRRLMTGRPVENIHTTLRRKDGTVCEVLLSSNTLLGDASSTRSGVIVAVIPLPPPPEGDSGKLAIASLVDRRAKAAAAERSAPAHG
jgi:PAS domain S-box-containing protein